MVVDAEDQPFNLWQNLGEKATVLVFTRSDCPISNRYAPTVRSLYDKYHPQGVNFYLVYIDPREDAASIRNHLGEYQYPCKGVRDPLHSIVKLTQATVTPEAVVFDSRRKMAYRGRIDNLYESFGVSRAEPTTHDLTAALDSILAGQAVAQPVTKAVGCYIGDLE